jgi:hypothetical protein
MRKRDESSVLGGDSVASAESEIEGELHLSQRSIIASERTRAPRSSIKID